MIDNLRKKLATTSMTATNIVLVVAIIIIFFTGFSRINAIKENNMQRALDYPNDRSQEEFFNDFNDIVMVVCADNQPTVWFRGSKVSGEFMNTVMSHLGEVLQSDKLDSDKSFNFHYRKQIVDQNTVKVVFYDPSNSQSGFLPLAGYAIGTLLVGVLSHSVISTILAQSAIHPVEESWKKQKQFVADASHELKTPLSVIMANTEIIASHPDDTVDSQMKWINSTLEEAKRMSSLVADLLFLAKNDDGVQVQMQQTNLSDCVQTCVLSHEAVFYENNKVFNSDVADDIFVNGNEGQLKQLVTILLDNANKYSVGEGNIQLCLAVVGKNALLTVSNDSNEISPEQLSHIFDRFYVVDSSRNKDKGGNGLGLSIAQMVCQTHGGNIYADYKDGIMTFKATLPLCKIKKGKQVE